MATSKEPYKPENPAERKISMDNTFPVPAREPIDAKTVSSEKPSVFSKMLQPTTSLQYLKGVGPKLAQYFSRKNINTVYDLIHWYPRTYRDQRAVRDFSQMAHGTYVTLFGYVEEKKTIHLRSGKTLYLVMIKTEGGEGVTCKYFRLPYRGYFDSLDIYQKVKVVGKITYYDNQPELHHPDIYPFKESEGQKDMLLPVYTEMEKVSQNKIRKMIDTAFAGLKQNPDFINSDPLPLWLREDNNLLGKVRALELLHQPDQDKVEEYLRFRSPAQKRLIFEEFFFLQLYMGMKSSGLKKEKTQPIKPALNLSDKLKNSLPFELTSAQKRVLTEISQDMQNDYPMHRLVQGDVGCGKTVVALLSACQVIENGFQCAIMAPTEILAEQHYKNAVALLQPLGIHVSLLTSSIRVKQKREILEKLASGYTSLCIGTHALIQEAVQFKNLALVVIDEQHRFGVHQRGLLKGKGMRPHFLVMTATPIPRSLALTLYGDLNVSVIDEMPKGRKTIVTQRMYASKRDQVWGLLENQILSGRQAYIVYPLVEESEHVDLKNAVEEYEKLKVRFPDFKSGLVHGRLSFYEKQEVMSAFARGEIQILVSTTVIEVGVDVPNASIMIVEHAERFGLSQLHQLRGRVGRGEYTSYCILVMEGFSKEAFSRLSIMEKTADGFKIAEADLERRGPGEFLGTRQSGLPAFRMAHLVRDVRLLQQARESAHKMIKKDPHLNYPEHELLKKEMQKLSNRLLPG